jgi:NADH-quinone oxidoreductase subunit H
MFNETIKNLIYFLIAPGLAFTAVIGLLSTWVDRKLSARLQWRKGPPWFQPFADIIKLMGKEVMVPEGGAKEVFLSAPLVALAAVTLVSTMLWMFNLNPQVGFVGDLIVVLYLLTIPSLALIVGGSSSRNPLSALGASREMKLILAYELPFLLATFTVIMKAGTLVMGNIVGYQAGHGMIMNSASGFIALLVTILVVQAKLGYPPFDIAEAEQEIMAGPLLEYSGAPLGIFRLSKAMLLFVLPVFVITLYLGGINLSSWTGGLWLLLKYLILLLVVILIKNTNPRLRIDQAVRFFWGPVMGAAIVGIILALIGW